MVQEMVAVDLENARHNVLLKQHGYDIPINVER